MFFCCYRTHDEDASLVDTMDVDDKLTDLEPGLRGLGVEPLAAVTDCTLDSLSGSPCARKPFTVTIVKPQGGALGLSVGRDGECALKVQCVEAGPIRQWNDAHPPEDQVMEGDTIIEVNDIRGSTNALLDVIATRRILRLKIQPQSGGA